MNSHRETLSVNMDTELPEAELYSVEVWRLLHSPLQICNPEQSLQQVIQRMFESRSSAMVIIDAGQLLGIWTERDASHLSQRPDALDDPIRLHMSAPVKTLPRSATLREAGVVMQRERVRHLVVVDEQQLPMGLFSLSDLIRHQGVEYYLALRDVDSAITRLPLVMAASTPAIDAFRLMYSQLRDAMLVEFADGVMGIATEHDWVRLLVEGEMQRPIGELIPRQVETVASGTPLLMARNLMESRGFRHVGITTTSGQVKAILSYGDILSSIEYTYVNRLQSALDQRNQALRESMEHLRLAQKVIEASLDAIIVTDADGIIRSVNPSFSAVTGYSAEEAIGRSPSLLSSGRHDQAFYDEMWSTLRSKGSWQGEIWNKRKNGQVFPEWITITAITDEQGEVKQYAAIFSDISDRKQREEQIKRLAYFDELTGLANRRLFQDRLERAIANAHRHQHRLGVFFLDLDMFKRINDSLGHSVGDQVLKLVAERLQGCLREGDTAARLGGDEFTVLVPEVASDYELEGLASRLLKVLSVPLQVGEHELHISTSIGIACYPDDGDSVELLLKRADTAMYRSKDDGRNSYNLFRRPLEEESHARLSMESELRTALKQGEFRLFFQPRISLDSNEVTGFEALIRWPCPQGMISPGQFLPLAQQLGLMPNITQWVLNEACRQLRAWQKEGRRVVPVAINLSVADLHGGSLVHSIQRALDHYHLAPELLEIEITENSFIPEKSTLALQRLHALRNLGLGIAIDDFGTGYSCLSYLKRLPLDYLKIDASFVRGLPADDNDVQLTTSLINLAHGLGLKVIAEGVERQQQRDFLLAAQCDEVQGFWFSEPLPSEQAVAWLPLRR